jgi:hypothetical protein
MSHVTDVKLKIKDLDALEEACEELGLELKRDKKNFAWWGRFLGDSHQYGNHDPNTFGQCEHAIGIKGDRPMNGSNGPWEIGVVKALDGDGYDLLYDNYGGAGRRLTEKIGEKANKLRQEYAAAVSTKKVSTTLARKGWKVERERLSNGTLRLKVRKR